VAVNLKQGEIVRSRYKVRELLGRGGWSEVYLVDDMNLSGTRAMKVVDASYLPDGDQAPILEQLDKEIRILGSLSHPHIPQVYDHFILEGRHFLVRDYVEGETLEEIARGRKEPFTDEEIRGLAVKACDILAFMHGRGIVLRDLKPNNIVVTAQGDVKIIDCGVARWFRLGKGKDTLVVGTPGYAAPEQYGAGQSDERTDIYALGATLYFLATGSDPGDHPFTFARPSASNGAVSPLLEAVILKSLEIDPRARFSKVLQIKELLLGRISLEDIEENLPILATDVDALRVENVGRLDITRKYFKVFNLGGGTLKASARADVPWIEVDPGQFASNDVEMTVKIRSYEAPRRSEHVGRIIFTTERETRIVPVKTKLAESAIRRLPDWAGALLVLWMPFVWELPMRLFLLVLFYMWDLFSYAVGKIIPGAQSAPLTWDVLICLMPFLVCLISGAFFLMFSKDQRKELRPALFLSFLMFLASFAARM
jgi:serine/threonine protein kinase